MPHDAGIPIDAEDPETWFTVEPGKAQDGPDGPLPELPPEGAILAELRTAKAAIEKRMDEVDEALKVETYQELLKMAARKD